MTTYLIYDDTGHAVSIGTVLADPMPEHLTVVELDPADADLLAAGRGLWDVASLKVAAKPEHLWPTPPDDAVSDEAPAERMGRLRTWWHNRRTERNETQEIES